MAGRQEPPAAFQNPRDPIRYSTNEFGIQASTLTLTDPTEIGMRTDVVVGIFLSGSSLTQMTKMWSHIQKYTSLSSLVVKGCGISKLDSIDIPTLRLLNLADNQISREVALVKFLKPLQGLRELDLRGNPVKDMAAVADKATGILARLEVINGADIELESRVKCVETLRKNGRALAPNVRWDWTITALPGIMDRPLWDPLNIRKLILPNTNLTVFHVRPFRNLEALDLSCNSISTLTDSGLAYCEALRVCDFRQNAITKRDQLMAVQFNLELRMLNLSGNEVTKVKDYRSYVISATRACSGDGRTTGLLVLDGVDVTLEERCASFAQHAPPQTKAADHDLLRWRLTAISYFGRAELALHPEEARFCILPDKKLAIAELQTLENLRVLDLSRNALSSLVGISKLTHLISVDLSDNPKLNLTSILPQFSGSSLQQVVFQETDDKRHARGDPLKPVYRNQILQALLMANPHLNYIDEILVTPTERIETYAHTGASAADVELYRFRLGCALQSMKLPRLLHPSFLDPARKVYARESVTNLSNMNGFGLSTADFSPFNALQVLNLRDNKIADFESLNLHKLKRLKKLDLSDNLIQAKLHVIGFFLDDMKSLRVLALAGNPCMRTADDRAKLIACMESMKLETPYLRRLDQDPITIRERMQVLSSEGVMTREAADELRIRSIAVNRLPLNLDCELVTQLDFSDTGLRAIGLSKYCNLQVLLLRGNSIRTIQSVQGIASLSKLEVLDLRDNELSNFSEIALAVEHSWVQLQALGLSGNKLPKEYRQQLLTILKYLPMRKSPFVSMDDTEITPDELFAAAQRAGTLKTVKNLQQFRFDLAFIRRVPDTTVVSELDLSKAGLELLNLDGFPQLRKLSLAHNSLSNKFLVASQVATLTALYWLDLRFNKIRNLESLATCLAPLTNLVDLSFVGNPCCGNLSRTDVGKRFERFLEPSVPLVYLNDAELTVEERCDIASALGKKEIDLFRLQFCAFQRNVNEEATTLDLSLCGLRTLGGLQIFTNLVSLNLSGNGATVFEKFVFAYMPSLKYLDLHNNSLDCSLVVLTESLGSCSQLSTLFILNSLSDGSTARRNQYLVSVFQAIPSCMKLDGHKRSLDEDIGAAAVALSLASVKGMGPRASLSGLSSRPTALNSANSIEKRKRKSLRRVRVSGIASGDSIRKSSSNAASPPLSRVPKISVKGLGSAGGDVGSLSPTSAAAKPNSGASSPKSVSGSKSPKSPKSRLSAARAKSPPSSSSSPPSSPPSSSSSASSPPPKAKHRRTPSGGVRKKDDTLTSGSVSTSSKVHRRSGSTGSSKVKREQADSLGSPLAPKRGSTKRVSSSRRNSSARGLASSADDSAMTPLAATQVLAASAPLEPLVFDGAALAAAAAVKQRREEAIQELEDFQHLGSNEESLDPSVDEFAVSSAADFLRGLDFGSPRDNSDDEYAESDEAEWNDLSFEEEVEDEGPLGENPSQVDPRLVLKELEMFRINEVEVEIEAPAAAAGEEVFLDKFDLGTARGSTTQRGSLRGSTASGSPREKKGSLRGASTSSGSPKERKGSLRGSRAAK